MKRNKLLILSIVTITFIGCGGGGSSDTSSNTATNTSTPTLKTISGSVPGTIIEALCKDGSYYKTTSIQNGTTKHPFELKLPQNVECKIIMTTNENDPNKMAITPLKFKTTNGTGTYLALIDDTNIGYVPLDLNSSGVKPPIEVEVDEQAAKVIELSFDPLDKDKDGIPNIYEDDDNDGKVNKYDEDDDNDGILDSEDSDYQGDKDGDGVEDKYDRDDDNDGIEDQHDKDDKSGDADDEGDNDDNEENKHQNSNSNNNTPTTPISSFTKNDGRLLGSVGCAQCHGTNGNSVTSWDGIAKEGEFATENFSKHPIMQTIADGYKIEEKSVIDNWLSTLSENEKGDNDEDDD